MGAEVISQQTVRIAITEESIRESETKLQAFKTQKEQYYSRFWKQQCDHTKLQRQHQTNPSEETKKKLRQLDANIAFMEKKLKEIRPDETIQQLEQTIAAQKAEFQRLTNPEPRRNQMRI